MKWGYSLIYYDHYTCLITTIVIIQFTFSRKGTKLTVGSGSLGHFVNLKHHRPLHKSIGKDLYNLT
jgi:hypothetical protein